MNGRDHVEDLVDGYLLGALEPDEHARVRGHLRGCGSCARLLGASRDVLGVLPLALDELAPRPEVKASLVAAVRSAGAPPRRLLPFRIDSDSANPVLRWASLGMAAAFVLGLVGGLTGWALVLGDRLERRDDDLARRESLLEAVANSRRVLTMEGTEAAPEVRAALIVARNTTQVLLLADHVPRPATGQAYHLWFFANGTALPGGVLVPDDSGDIAAIVEADVSKLEKMEIDVQPAGATAPGGVTVIEGALK